MHNIYSIYNNIVFLKPLPTFTSVVNVCLRNLIIIREKSLETPKFSLFYLRNLVSMFFTSILVVRGKMYIR